MENIDFDKLKEISNTLIDLMLKKHPNCEYSVNMLLWSDGDYQIHCFSNICSLDINKPKIERCYMWSKGYITYTKSEEYNGEISKIIEREVVR